MLNQITHKQTQI